jgi:hypothetical protein
VVKKTLKLWKNGGKIKPGYWLPSGYWDNNGRPMSEEMLIKDMTYQHLTNTARLLRRYLKMWDSLIISYPVMENNINLKRESVKLKISELQCEYRKKQSFRNKAQESDREKRIRRLKHMDRTLT